MWIIKYVMNLQMEWMNCNALSLNLNKTPYMIYTSKGRDAQDLDIKLNGQRFNEYLKLIS